MRSVRLLVFALACAGFACSQPEVCGAGEDPPAVPLTKVGSLGYVPYAHSHNDYAHPRPLLDALDAGFYSIEADIWYAGGRFEVKHNSWDASLGTIEELYLAPLQARVDGNGGSVYGDGRPVTLWVDIKDSDAQLPAKLEALLAKYAMLTSYDGATTAPGAVSVQLTGDAKMKGAFVQQAVRHAARDSNDFSPSDPPADNAWTAYALDWGTYLSWDGSGSVPAATDLRMRCIAAKAHALGRKVRLYAAPDRFEFWQAAIDRGIDFIHTDHLQEARAYLLSAP
jgi:hypothetical protein